MIKNNNNNCQNDKKINGATGINGDINDAKKKINPMKHKMA